MSASDTTGEMYIAYYDLDKQAIRIGWSDSGGWKFAYSDGIRDSLSTQRSPTGIKPTINKYGGSMQLFYYDFHYGLLRHSWTNLN